MCTVFAVVDITGLDNVEFNTYIPSMKGYSGSSAVLQLVVSCYKNFAILDIPQLFLTHEFISEPSPLAAHTDTTQAEPDNFCDNKELFLKHLKAFF